MRSGSRSRSSTSTESARPRPQAICDKAGVKVETRTKDLTDDEVRRIRETIEQNLKVEGDLRREVSMNIKRLMDLGCYRGLRHRKGLPGPRPAHAHQRAHAEGAEEGARPQGPGRRRAGAQGLTQRNRT